MFPGEYLEKSQPYYRSLVRTIHQTRSWPLTRRSQVAILILLLCCLLFLLHLRDNLYAIRLVNVKNTEDLQTESEPLIPRKIWQIHLPVRPSDRRPIDEHSLGDTLSWLAKNTDYNYTLVGLRGANQFVDTQFREYPWIAETYHALRNPASKSDLLRYLLLSREGGVYTDTDTTAIRPIDEWVPREMRGLVRLVVGVEFDGGGHLTWWNIPHDLQFCQWTIAAAPGHRVFDIMIGRAVRTLDDISVRRNKTISKLRLSSLEVLNSTGPAGWTDAVIEYLQETVDRNLTWRNITGMKEPSRYADVLVLPIDGFGMGQPHSNSTNNGTTPKMALASHHFHGSWRGV